MDVRAHSHFTDHFATLELGVRTELRCNGPAATTPGGAPVMPTVNGAPDPAPGTDADNDAPAPPDGDAANAAEIIGENPVAPDGDGAAKGEAELNTEVERTGDNFAEASDTSDATDEDLDSTDAATEQQASNDAARRYDAGADHVDALGDQQADLWGELNTRIDIIEGAGNRKYNENGEADGGGQALFGPGGMFEGQDRTAVINAVINDPGKLQIILDATRDAANAEGGDAKAQLDAIQGLHDFALRYQTSEAGEISTTQTLDTIEARLNETGHTQALDGVRLTDRTNPDNVVDTNAERIATLQAQVDAGTLQPGLAVSETGNIVVTVQPGDSYWAIKERYNMTQEQYQAFRELNQPRMTNYEGGNASTTSYFAMLQTGDQLLFPGDVQAAIYTGGPQRDVVNAASYQFGTTGVTPAPQASPAPSPTPAAPAAPQAPQADATRLGNALSNLWTGGEGDFGQLTAALDGESSAGTDYLREYNGQSVQQRVEAQIRADIARGMTPQDAIIAFADSVQGIDDETRLALKMNLAAAYGVQFG